MPNKFAADRKLRSFVFEQLSLFVDFRIRNYATHSQTTSDKDTTAATSSHNNDNNRNNNIYTNIQTKSRMEIFDEYEKWENAYVCMCIFSSNVILKTRTRRTSKQPNIGGFACSINFISFDFLFLSVFGVYLPSIVRCVFRCCTCTQRSLLMDLIYFKSFFTIFFFT